MGQTSVGSITGKVHGGRQAISGAHVYLYAAGIGGNGGPGIAASTANASTSLLTVFSTGSYPTTIDGAGHYYVTTNGSGLFSLTGEYTCTPGSQVYVYAVGGDPGIGSPNLSAGLMAILGNCPSTGTLAVQTPAVFVSEASTVAAAYAFAGYASDATHVSSSTSALGTAGIAEAFATASNLYDISGGHGNGALSAPATISGTVPQAELNSLANSLAACVNSTGASSTQCSALFSNVKSAGATGTTATDTATVAINIAHNPSNAVSTIFANPVGIGTPFLPTLSVAPHDYTVDVTFYSGTLGFPDALAIDATGNVWVGCYSSPVSKYSNLGAYLNPGGYSGGGLNHPSFIAIDSTGNAWLGNQGNNSVTEYSATGTALSPSTGFVGNNDLNPAGIAIDGSGYVWVTNMSKNTVSKLLGTTGAEVTGSPYSPTGLNQPWGLALDGSGNAWVGSYAGTNSVVELSSAGLAVGSSPFFSGSYNNPRTLAVTAAGGVAVSNEGNSSFTLTTSAGAGTNISTGGVSNSYGIAVDGAGNIWSSNAGNNTISAYASDGTAISPVGGYTSADINQPYGIGIDGAGNVWLANGNGDNLIEFVGVAVPAITPLVTAVATNKIGTRP